MQYDNIDVYIDNSTGKDNSGSGRSVGANGELRKGELDDHDND